MLLVAPTSAFLPNFGYSRWPKAHLKADRLLMVNLAKKRSDR